jgi:hypothetical protein
MTIKFLNTPHWHGGYTFAMLTTLAKSDLTLDEAIAIYTCGGEI